MRRLLAVATVVLAAACQPAGGPQAGATAAPGQAAPGDRLGAPASGVPGSLAALLDRTDPPAAEWQDEPLLAQVEVDLDEAGTWTAARAVYVAGGADSSLEITLAGDGVTEERPTLAALMGLEDVEPISAAGAAELPPLPDDARDPAVLAERAATTLDDCGAGPVARVLYDTGAPFTWDGSAWTSAPAWTAALVDAEGGGTVVDPATAEPVDEACL